MTNKELFAQMIIDFCRGTSCDKCKARKTCDKIDGGFDFNVEYIVKMMNDDNQIKEKIKASNYSESLSILQEAWEMSSKTQHNYLTSYDKMKVERLLDMIEEIVEMFE